MLALACGCATEADFTRRADRAVDDILGGSSERLNAERRATIVQPKPKAVAPAAPVAAGPPELRTLTLPEALEIAIQSNRDYMTQRESLYQTALSLTGTRHSFSPLLSSTLSYVLAGGSGSDETQNATWNAALSKRLETGGNLSLGASTGLSDNRDLAQDPTTYSSDISVSLAQPLLRGFGHEVAYEALTQAERSLMYSIRDFELYREGFSIDVASQYYDLVRQRRGVANQRRNIEDLVFARRKAEAMYDIGRIKELEVLRARREELTSQNDLIEAEENYRLALDRFRIFLGLPENVRLDVQEDAPEFVEIDYDIDSAVEVAFKNRLDVLNRTEQLEDVERSLRIAANALLPDLGLDLSWGLATGTENAFFDQQLETSTWSAGINFELPVDRLNERNAFRSAQIAYTRAKRDYELFVQELAVTIQSTFRGLERRKQSVAIQRQLIEDQERNVTFAQLRVELGEVSNREVLDAQEALLEARNSLIEEQVEYEIGRLRLIRDLGILFIDEHGMWEHGTAGE